MPDPSVLAILAGCLFVGAFIRATVGFGDALLAVPLMALFVEVRFATPLMSLCSVAVGLGLLVIDWRRIDVRRAWPLLAGGLVGLPVGVWLLRVGSPWALKLALGLFILVFCLYETFVRVPERLRGWPGLGYGFGFLAGLFGGMFTTPGPPTVAYGRLQDWPSDRFRATIVGFSVPFGLCTAAMHGLGGFWNSGVFVAFGCALPGLGLGLLLGNLMHRRIPAELFRRLIRGGLLAIAIALVAAALAERPVESGSGVASGVASGGQTSSAEYNRSSSR